MKPLRLVLLLASFIFIQVGIVYAQDDKNQPKKFAFGAGIDIGKLYTYDYFEPMANLILDFDLINSLRIEPEFGFSTTKQYDSNNNLDAEYKTVSYGSGFYGLIHFGNASTYFGLKFVKVTNNVERESSDDTYWYKLHQSNVGPVIGMEYKFAKRFSIGGEFDILYSKSHREETDMPDDESNVGKGWQTGNSLKFRFYF
jgi:Outer membrane protein beta-barrel domain